MNRENKPFPATAMDLATLNHTYAIPGTLEFVPLPGDLVAVQLRNPFAAATVALHGGHVMSYIPHGESDLLWMSKRSNFAADKPIRGGIPVCWPWFGAHPTDPAMPAHGFARLRDWEFKSGSRLANGGTRISLALPARREIAALWPHRFSLELVVTVADRLEVELVAGNPGDSPFTFTAALHSYFAVGDIAAVAVAGLDGVEYLDTVGGRNAREIQRGPIAFAAETDRIYLDTVAPCLIHDASRGRTIRVEKSGSRTTVVWNPWIAKAARMPDFGDTEYREMLCVETANAGADAVALQPGQRHNLKTIIGLA